MRTRGQRNAIDGGKPADAPSETDRDGSDDGE